MSTDPAKAARAAYEEERADLKEYLRVFLRPFHVVSILSLLVGLGLLVAACVLQRSEDPRIWFLLVLGPAGVAAGALVGFVYATFGEESERFSPVIAALNGVLGGAAATDLAQDDSAIVEFFRSLADACALADGGGIVFLVLVTFAGIGFFNGYINKKLILNRATALQDKAIRALAEQAKEEKQAKKEQGPGGKYRATALQDKAIRVIGLQAADQVVLGDESQGLDTSDPQKGLWGGQAEMNGRRLSARVSPSATDTELFWVELEVRSVNPQEPLRGTVRFHLHPTFRDPSPVVAVVQGVAQLKVLAWGAFTVGAEADDGETKLELDLSTVPDAPKEFRER